MTRYLFVAILMVMETMSSYAQNSILAGKVTDENGRPVAGAMVRIRNKAESVFTTAKSDTDGFYCSKLMPAGTYHVMLVARGKQHRLHKLDLPDMTKEKKYFNMVLKDKDVDITIVAEDEHIKNRIAEIAARQKNVEGPGPRRPSSMQPMKKGSTHEEPKVPAGEAVPQGK